LLNLNLKAFITHREADNESHFECVLNCAKMVQNEYKRLTVFKKDASNKILSMAFQQYH